MNHLHITLAARSYELDRALRVSGMRHRRLVDAPLAVVVWQLGAEPFSAAALGWGTSLADFSFGVAGDPRNRDLNFALLLRFAQWFNPHFERHAAGAEPEGDGPAPQVVVANTASVEMLGRLGRRLAYLPTDGPQPASPELVRLGRHLLFLHDHWVTPGQQLLVSLTELVGQNWITPQSEGERKSLPALDAYIEPRGGLGGYACAVEVEHQAVGPTATGEDEVALYPLVEEFNRLRSGRTAPAVVAPLLRPLEGHYRPLTQRAWRLLWQCWARERTYQEAPSVRRRWVADRRAYFWHVNWLNRGGMRLTRQTQRQAVATLRRLEEATRLLEAEEACDDLVRLVPAVLANNAVKGRVTAVDLDYRERAVKQLVRRPLVTVMSQRPCLMPTGKELWWVCRPVGKPFVVHAARPLGSGSELTLKLTTSSDKAFLPPVGCETIFSVYNTGGGYVPNLPEGEPWTHRRAVPEALAAAIEN